MNLIRSIAEKQRKYAHLKVLIIDDQSEIRALIREVLVEMGVTQVLEAADGEAAMQLMDTDFNMANLVICDWNMPGMNGVEFLRKFRTVYADYPFLMVTGRSDKNSIMEAKAAGVSAYIRKPFSPDQLEEKILALVESSKKIKEENNSIPSEIPWK